MTELILAHHSLRRAAFEERVAAAAGAGFTGIGLLTREYDRLRAEGRTDADLRAVLDAHHMRVLEIEALRGWDSGARTDAERTAYAIADGLGPALHLQAIGPYTGTLDDAAEAFAGLCDRAAEHALTVVIEFLPEMSNIPDAAAAWAIVRAAGRPNGGVCVDVWHHFRGANDDAMLLAVPADRVAVVQLDDGPLAKRHPDYKTDCTRYREIPGDGEFDLEGVLRLLHRHGVRAPVSVEVVSDELDRQPPHEVARRLAQATRRTLSAAGWAA